LEAVAEEIMKAIKEKPKFASTLVQADSLLPESQLQKLIASVPKFEEFTKSNEDIKKAFDANHKTSPLK
jgi:hypothetical protein